MKRLLVILLCLILCGCKQIGEEKIDMDQKYLSIIDSINDHENFATSSKYFDVQCEMAKINDGYRFYVTIDNPTLAMYDIQAMAIEKGVDYSKVMAASVGVVEDTKYAMIPNQANPDEGFYQGITISGIASIPLTTLYVYVNFKNGDGSNSYTEFMIFDVAYGAIYE